MAFAPQGHDLDNETQDEGRQSPAPRANGDDNPSQTQALATVTPVTGETPFDKPMILREILQFLSIEQLKTCKLVSKKWYRAAKHALSLKPGFRFKLPPPLPPINTSPLPTMTG
ncbi:MAG: F-box protein [Holosporaceae bacterium]